MVSLIKHFHCSSPHVSKTPGLCAFQCLLQSKKSGWRRLCLFCYFFFGRGGGAGGGGGGVVWTPSIFFLAVVELDGLDLFSNLRLALNLGLPVVSLQSRFYTSRVDTSCKKFHVLGLKNEEYSPKM